MTSISYYIEMETLYFLYVEDINVLKHLLCVGKKFDGTKDSLLDKSHRPLSPHPNSHTLEELTWIKNYIRRNPNISLCDYMEN